MGAFGSGGDDPTCTATTRVENPPGRRRRGIGGRRLTSFDPRGASGEQPFEHATSGPAAAEPSGVSDVAQRVRGRPSIRSTSPSHQPGEPKIHQRDMPERPEGGRTAPMASAARGPVCPARLQQAVASPTAGWARPDTWGAPWLSVRHGDASTGDACSRLTDIPASSLQLPRCHEPARPATSHRVDSSTLTDHPALLVAAVHCSMCRPPQIRRPRTRLRRDPWLAQRRRVVSLPAGRLAPPRTHGRTHCRTSGPRHVEPRRHAQRRC